MIFGRWVSHAVATSTLILHTNKCTTWSHHSTWGCFLEVPVRVSEAQCLGCAEELPWGSKCCPGPWYLKMSIFLCVFRGREGGVGRASWPCLQDHNRWPTGHLRCVLLVPSLCYICFTLQLWLPGDCFLTVPHSRHHGYTIPIVGNRPQHLQTQTDTSMKTLFKPEITTCTARHSKPTIRQSFISLAHSGNTGHCITAITSLLIFRNIQISHVM